MTSSLPPDAAAIQALVAEVVRRVLAGQQAAASPSRGASEPARGAPAVAMQAPAPFVVAGRVVTVAAIERVPAGLKDILIETRAVVTPSAADLARERGLALVRSATSAADAPSRPFVIAQAACRDDASSRAAAIARAIPGSQRLPPSGMSDVIVALASHASKDAARGVLLTGRPALAVVLANRSPSLRAVAARDASSLLTAAAEAAANLLIIDPGTLPAAALERLCGDFHRGPASVLPAELAAAPPGCGCTSHRH